MGNNYRFQPSAPPIPIKSQISDLIRTYKDSWVTQPKAGVFYWYHKITPTPISSTYTVRIMLTQNRTPRVYIVDPKPLPKAEGKDKYEHMYDQKEQHICLHLADEWNTRMRIADTLVPWTSEWLISYECWASTGKWTGGGLHRNIYTR